MDLLKKENWPVWLLITAFASNGATGFILGYLLDVYDKDAWYAKWQYWVIGVLCCFFPAIIMFAVFYFQIMAKVAAKLDVPGKEIYTSPYTWILCLVVPILGWVMFGVMYLYFLVWILVRLSQGEGEKYIAKK